MKALVRFYSIGQASQGGGVYVNESCFVDHVAMVVFLSKKSIANAYESFATVRKGL